MPDAVRPITKVDRKRVRHEIKHRIIRRDVLETFDAYEVALSASEARVTALREAIEPFRIRAMDISDDAEDERQCDSIFGRPNVGDFRRARSIYEEAE